MPEVKSFFKDFIYFHNNLQEILKIGRFKPLWVIFRGVIWRFLSEITGRIAYFLRFVPYKMPSLLPYGLFQNS